MRFFYDTEFVELGRERKILPLSIGMVSEDGREFYAQYIGGGGLSAGFQHDWVRQNVLPHLKHIKLSYLPSIENPTSVMIRTCGKMQGPFTVEDPPYCGQPDCPWMTDAEIAAKLIEFVQPSKENKPEIWAYYADYDHVVLSQTFGPMMDLPAGWSMYTRDLKQWSADIERRVNERRMVEALLRGEKSWEPFKLVHPPGPEGEHDALVDARWNLELYGFLKNTELQLDI